MQFRSKHWFASAALVGAALLATTHTLRAQQDAKKGPAVGGSDPALMMKMMELAKPGKPHEELAKLVGKWDLHYKLRMAPDSPWVEFTGTSEVKSLLGGRYVMEEAQCEVMRIPMQRISIIGYDNMKQEYTSLLMDSMSTWWKTSRGTKNADGVTEYKGTMVDVAGERPFRMVIHSNADGSVDREMYDTIPPQGDVQVMSIHATKKM